MKYIFLILKKYWAIFLCLIFGVCLFMMHKQNQALKNDNERLSINQNSLLSDIKTYKSKNGDYVSQITQLTLSRDEFKNACNKQKELINNLNLKIKNIDAVTSTGTKTEIIAKTVIKDSIIYVDNKIDTLKHFNWNDRWTIINGTINKDTVECTYTSVDTLNIVAVKIPKKFLFFKFGCKYIEIHTTNSNPHTKITYSSSIKLKK